MKIDFSESRPNPEDARKEFLSAALLVPSLSKNPPADQATLIKAIAAVDLSALDARDQEKFDASLKRAQSTLETLRPLLAAGNASPHRQLTYRRRLALALDGNSGRRQAHLLDCAAVDERVSGLHLHTVGCAVQRMDGRKISGDKRRRSSSASRKAAGRSWAACGSSLTSTCPTANRPCGRC